MYSIITPLRHALLLTACGLAGLAYLCSGIETSDLSFPLTRDEADAKLSKDYSYAVMADGTIRRTWPLHDRKIFIDFDSGSNDAILISIDYERPVAKNVGIGDANILGKGKMDEEAKWEKPKDMQAVAVFGFTNPRWKRLSDGSMLFYELTDKGRISRVSLFAAKPHTNRWQLAEANPDDKQGVMGGQFGEGQLEGLYKDEARRMATATADASSSTETAPVTEAPKKKLTITTTSRHRSAMGSSPGGSPSAEPQTDESVSEPSAPVASADSNEAQPTVIKKKIKLDQGRRHSRSLSFLPTPPDWLKKAGIEEPTWWHYLGLGIGALLLLIFIIRSMAQGSSKAKQRRRFSQVVANAPKKGNMKIGGQ